MVSVSPKEYIKTAMQMLFEATKVSANGPEIIGVETTAKPIESKFMVPTKWENLQNYALVDDMKEEMKPVHDNTSRDVDFTMRVIEKVDVKKILNNININLQDNCNAFLYKDLQHL